MAIRKDTMAYHFKKGISEEVKKAFLEVEKWEHRWFDG